MQLDLYLTLLSTSSKFTWLPFPKNLESISLQIMTTQSSSGNTLVAVTGLSSKLLPETPNSFTKLYFFPVNHHGTLARKERVMTLFETGK